MTWRTHALGGVAALWLLRPFGEMGGVGIGTDLHANVGLLAALSALGALLPDLDANESKAKHLALARGIEPLALPSLLLSRLLGHRGLTHSLLGWGIAAIVVGLPLALLAGPLPALALLLGYGSHVLLDGCTRHGVPLLYPDRRRWHALPAGWRVTTGSQAEDGVFLLLTLITLPLLLSALVP